MKIKVYFRGYAIVEADDLDIAEDIFDREFVQKQYVVEKSEYIFAEGTDIEKLPKKGLCNAMFGKRVSELDSNERKLYLNALSRRRYRKKMRKMFYEDL